jgi:hypothetical protein
MVKVSFLIILLILGGKDFGVKEKELDGLMRMILILVKRVFASIGTLLPISETSQTSILCIVPGDAIPNADKNCLTAFTPASQNFCGNVEAHSSTLFKALLNSVPNFAGI